MLDQSLHPAFARYAEFGVSVAVNTRAAHGSVLVDVRVDRVPIAVDDVRFARAGARLPRKLHHARWNALAKRSHSRRLGCGIAGRLRAVASPRRDVAKLGVERSTHAVDARRAILQRLRERLVHAEL